MASVALDEANAELADAEYQERRIRTAYEARQEEKAELSARVESQAVELYMQAASGPSMGMVSLSSPSEALTAYEFLRANADESMQSVNDLASVSSELDRLGITLEAAVGELTTARDQQQEQTAEQESAMTSALGAYDDLSDRCRELQAEYEAEQARCAPRPRRGLVRLKPWPPVADLEVLVVPPVRSSAASSAPSPRAAPISAIRGALPDRVADPTKEPT